VSGGSSVPTAAARRRSPSCRRWSTTQKKQLLALRSRARPDAVLLRDVDNAQRAYEGVSQRVTALTWKGQNIQATCAC
jgi:hypothetical protein